MTPAGEDDTTRERTGNGQQKPSVTSKNSLTRGCCGRMISRVTLMPCGWVFGGTDKIVPQFP